MKRKWYELVGEDEHKEHITKDLLSSGCYVVRKPNGRVVVRVPKKHVHLTTVKNLGGRDVRLVPIEGPNALPPLGKEAVEAAARCNVCGEPLPEGDEAVLAHHERHRQPQQDTPPGPPVDSGAGAPKPPGKKRAYTRVRRVTAEMAEAVKRMHQEGASDRDIARTLGLGYSTVAAIVKEAFGPRRPTPPPPEPRERRYSVPELLDAIEQSAEHLMESLAELEKWVRALRQRLKELMGGA